MKSQGDKETIGRLMMNWHMWKAGPSISSSAGMWARAGRSNRAEASMPVLNADAQRTDATLALLSEREREALRMEYLETLSQHERSMRLKLSTRQYYRVLARAETAFMVAFRDGVLDRRLV